MGVGEDFGTLCANLAVPGRIARDNGSLVELSSGVEPGDRLVLNISSQIASGQTVAANEAEASNKSPPLGAKR
jgi:hypothetical protein